MNGNKNSNKPSIAPPSTPTQQNAFYYDGGNLKSSSIYDKSKGGYVNNTFNTPAEQSIKNNSTGFINNLMSQAPSAFNMSPEALQQGVDAYTKPQINALNTSYNQAEGSARNAAAGSGMSNSVGFGKYNADQIERNRAQGLADIAAGGEQMRYQLPSMAIQPYADAFNLAQGALNGQNVQTNTNLNPSFSGSQASNSFALQNYQNKLNAYNNSFFGRMNNNNSGIFSLFGGL
jgi:hypothetical protein